jgi:small-conductance mechanosensitive channel
MQLKHMNNHAILSLIVLLLCLTPFFDAYAPTSYISIEYIVLLAVSSVIIFKNKSYSRISWLIFLLLFIANTLACLLMEPTFHSRLWLLAIHVGIIVFSILFYRKLSKQIPYSKWIRIAVITGILLSCLGILLNLFGRFSLSCIFGLSAIFAITQAVVLPIFIDSFVEIFLVQLLSSRLKKGVNKPFDCSYVVNKIKGTMVMVAVLLWLIMLASNLNIYHNISSYVTNMLSANRSIGSISFRLNSILFFFIIIWIAHILQQLISFLFGETGIEAEEITSATKGQHSRLLISRLLVLIGGYLLAIAASGLPIDKLTFLLGALGVGIGMGLQSVVNNFVSGIILIFDGSLKIGDEIEVGGQAGKVKEIGLRASTITTGDGAEVIIPNGSILSQNIINWTFSNDEKRVMLQFVLYGKELDSNIINEVINTTIKSLPNVISKKTPAILYTKVTQDTCSLTVKFWSVISKTDSVKSEAMLKLSAAFSSKNIEFV